MESKLKEKLQKLYELAKRGVDGERVNAEFMLNKMLEKHGFTIDDIDGEAPKDRYYKYTTEMSRKLVLQIIYRVTERDNIWTLRGYKEVGSEVSDYEHIQILEQIDFHLQNFNEERKQFLKDFTSAYIQKHKLFSLNPKEKDEERKPLSMEEKQAIWRMSAIKETLSNKTYTKKLN